MQLIRRPIYLILAPLLWLVSLPAHAAGGATYTPGNDQHLDMQHQIGAKTFVDCGKSSEADLRSLETSTGWIPSKEIREIIGTPAPEFANDLQWVNCKPMTMAQLRGHPVFIRFWYRNCRMCDASAAVMNDLQKRYAKDGLVVIGIHHSKTTRGDTLDEVRKAAVKLGFKFPIANDNSWSTIENFWIHSKQRAYSSASFLVNAKGIIVWGHDLGRLEPDTAAAQALFSAAEKLVSQEKRATD